MQLLLNLKLVYFLLSGKQYHESKTEQLLVFVSLKGAHLLKLSESINTMYYTCINFFCVNMKLLCINIQKRCVHLIFVCMFGKQIKWSFSVPNQKPWLYCKEWSNKKYSTTWSRSANYWIFEMFQASQKPPQSSDRGLEGIWWIVTYTLKRKGREMVAV